MEKTIKSALISVFYKDGLEPVIEALKKHNVTMYSTGGTQQFIEKLGGKVTAVEDVTGYPSILGGRVKTLHPKVFGGILARRDNNEDAATLDEYEIPPIDLVIVDLYPFEETVAKGGTEAEVIEKIDIGGVSLIRAAAKNFKDTLIVCDKTDYGSLAEVINKQNGKSTLEQRKYHAGKAFHVTSHYDGLIFKYFDKENTALKLSIAHKYPLRYGENPHQQAAFFGKLNDMFEQLHGKELSYNNLLDVDAAVNMAGDFKTNEALFAILKHNNACGFAIRKTGLDAWKAALAGDPVSAFGGVIITNKEIDDATAVEIDKLFCEVLIAPSYSAKALEVLKSKKNRIILIQKPVVLPQFNVRSALNGVLWQQRDSVVDTRNNFTAVTEKKPTEQEIADLEFANILVKHTKSNTIILAKNNTLLAGGTGQTSRVDALKQAIEKAKSFTFDLHGAVMASDAFFPFPDCVEIAHKAGITAVVQPGGSIKDNESIDYCNKHGIAMVFTGNRHFKH
ncbi:MAG TPA: bifunctional phosphoribosylaminoimidazolecarboxamide formyltransferase/IMP cyclohydrolase [Flavobacteriales bacterium]|nr:bifunctional phosphoribosylaminoimidazolecarboxamide formyltransferase/IMP cyclohydrolase [Flavobacteriales bacterium]